MTNLILCVLLFFLINGVFVFQTDGVKFVSVIEGDTVTLSTCLSDIQNYRIQWIFGPENLLLAKFNKGVTIPDNIDEIFRDRLRMDSDTGSLTIRNVRTNHSGVYEADISGPSGSPKKVFNVTVIGVFDPDAYNITQVLTKEGTTVSLETNVHVQKDHLILWTYVKVSKNCVYNLLQHVPCLSHATHIARIDGENREPSFDAGDYQMFDKILKMEKTTGSLTVKNIRPEHSGFYILQITNNTAIRYRRFNVTVSADPKSDSHNVWQSLAVTSLVLLVLVLLVLLLVVCYFKNKNDKDKKIEEKLALNTTQGTQDEEKGEGSEDTNG